MTMTPLTKSLEKRIHDLRLAIESQKTQLAAYERVLALESGSANGEEAGHDVAVSAPKATQAVHKAPAAPPKNGSVPFKGSKSEYVSTILKAHPNGVSPKEISDQFRAHKIKAGKNLIYNVLSNLYKQKKVTKHEGLYMYVGGGSVAAVAAPATADSKAAAPVSAKPGPGKSRISEEGMKRIIAATKRRWAKQKAMQKTKAH